jgi:hypothetical protein
MKAKILFAIIKGKTFLSWRDNMAQTVAIEVEMPDDLVQFRLPAGINARLQYLLDRQDSGIALSVAERQEAEGLVNLAELLSLLRLRAERVGRPRAKRP